MNDEPKIRLQLTEVNNLQKHPDGRLTVVDPALVFEHVFDPKLDVSIYDRMSLEEQVISISSFDTSIHLLKSGEKYFYALDFGTMIR